ncbi:unnamed protein product, partial [Polarella glacialis]
MAAADAATRPVPLVSKEGLKRIVIQAVQDFNKITGWSENCREAEVERLNQSILRACAVLRALDVDDAEVELIDAETHSQLALPNILATITPTADQSGGRSFFGMARGLAQGKLAVPVKPNSASPVPESPLTGSHGAECGTQTEEAESLSPSRARSPEVGPQVGPAVDAASSSEAHSTGRSKSIFGLARGLVGGASKSPQRQLEAHPHEAAQSATATDLTPLPCPRLPTVELPPLASSREALWPPAAEVLEISGAPTSGAVGSGISFLGLARDFTSKFSSAAPVSEASAGADTVQ